LEDNWKPYGSLLKPYGKTIEDNWKPYKRQFETKFEIKLKKCLKFLVAMFGSTFALGPEGPEEKGGKN
jgi:hypothetical protein